MSVLTRHQARSRGRHRRARQLADLLTLSSRAQVTSPSARGLSWLSVLALAAGTGVVAVLVAASIRPMLAVMYAGFAAAAFVVTCASPRRAGVILMAAVAATLPATGIGVVGTVTVADLAPAAMLAVTFLPGVVRPGHVLLSWQNWAVVIAVAMAIGGGLAALAGAASFVPIARFAATAIPIAVAIVRLDPDWDEMRWIVLGLLAGIAFSTIAGLLVFQSTEGRAIGLTLHSNQYAMLAVMALPLLWLMGRSGGLARTAAGAWMAVMLVGLLESGSRSGVFAFAVVLVVFAWRRIGVAGSLAAAVGVVATVALFGLPAVDTPTTDRLGDSAATQASDQGRIELMSDGYQRLVEGNFVLGSGLPREGLPHNVLLLVWGGMGLIGLAAFLALVWLAVVPALRRRTETAQWALSLAILAFVAVTALNNQLNSPVAWTLIALLQVARSHQSTMAVDRPAAVPVG